MIPSDVFYQNKKIIEIKNNTGGLYLTWVINNICTNHCSYCPEILHTGQNHSYDWEQVKRFVLDCNSRYGHINCSISGGEPTLSPFFKDLVNLIYDTGGSIVLTTNLARTKSWWTDIVPKISNMSISYHSEFVPEELEDEYIEKILYVKEFTYVNVRVMMYPPRWDRCINFYNKLKDKLSGFSLEIVRITPNFGAEQDFCTINYNAEQEKILSSTPVLQVSQPKPAGYRPTPDNYQVLFYDNQTASFDYSIASSLQNTNQNNFYGWECNLGLESLFVMYDGRVRSANCQEDSGWIGNINTGIEWPTQSMICNKKMCHCMADLFISKKQVKLS